MQVKRVVKSVTKRHHAPCKALIVHDAHHELGVSIITDQVVECLLTAHLQLPVFGKPVLFGVHKAPPDELVQVGQVGAVFSCRQPEADVLGHKHVHNFGLTTTLARTFQGGLQRQASPEHGVSHRRNLENSTVQRDKFHRILRVGHNGDAQPQHNCIHVLYWKSNVEVYRDGVLLFPFGVLILRLVM